MTQDTVTTDRSEREARKLYLRARQRMILSSTIGALVIIFAISILGAMGLFSPKTQKTVLHPEDNYNVITACLPEGAVAGNPAEITVRVLNGTNKSGLGSALGSELRNRGFNVQGVGDYDSAHVMTRTEIRFGKNAIAQAYTVATHFSDAILRMDTREDKLVDVIIGQTFNDLVNSDKALAPGSQMKSLGGCMASDQLADVPQAPEHTAVA